MVFHDCSSVFAMKFRHAIGIIHTNPNHGPLSDIRYPLSQFAGYSPEDMQGRL